MKTHHQEAPFAVQIELVEGCQLSCNFCGIHGIREKPGNFKFMTVKTARRIAHRLFANAWNSRIEFAMHGEPTMNPDYIEIIKVFRDKLPKNQLMMTSNGGGLLRPPGVVESLTQLFDAGLNIFAFDAYEYVKIKDKIDAVLFPEASKTGDAPWELPFEVHRYPDEKDFSPHSRYGQKARLFIRIKDISVAEKGVHSTLNNHCGAGSRGLRKPLEARCAKPFREMSVRWDGTVAICCNDWRGVFKAGDLTKQKLQNVWNGLPMQSARKFLLQGDRAGLKPCDVCDAKSYRVGLLPDKFGKVKLPKPDMLDKAVVHRAAGGKSLTEFVMRPWEIKRRAK